MKIIISQQCKKHMEAHKMDFIVEWRDLIKSIKQMVFEEGIREPFIVKELDMKRVIGYDKLIKVKETDEVVYAKRIHRNGYTRFVKNKEAVLTSIVVVILNQSRNNPNEYYLVTAYPGRIGFKEPQDLTISTEQELEACLDFWEQHALVFEEKSVDPSTITYKCPYTEMCNKND